MNPKLLTFVMVASLSVMGLGQESVTPHQDVLPGTAPLTITQPLHEVMVHGLSQYAEAELHAARERRTASWIDNESLYESTAAARARMIQSIGAVDTILAPAAILTAELAGPAVEIPNTPFAVTRKLARFDVAEGLTGEAIVWERKRLDAPDTDPHQPVTVVLINDPDCDAATHNAAALRFVMSGARVYAFTLVDRNTDDSMHPDIRRTNLTHREYIYRLGHNLGRHIIGYETVRAVALIETLVSRSATPDNAHKLILVGSGEGAVIAQYAAAWAPELVDAVVLHGYFGPRENVWQEPIYRNVWNQLNEFGDAELTSLMLPSHVIIEAGQAPAVTGPPKASSHQANIAAPGIIRSPQLPDVKREFERARSYFERAGHLDKLHLVEAPEQIGSVETIEILNQALDLQLKVPPAELLSTVTLPALEELTVRLQQKRLVNELVRHTQMLLARADKVRSKLWRDVDRSSADAWEKQATEYRELVHASFIGKLDLPSAAPVARSRKVIDAPTHVGYEIALNVHSPENWTADNPGVIAGGILLLPKGLQATEKRPVVVCQHGLEGTPQDTIETDESERAWRAYKGFSTQLVQRGFIVYAPQNPYKGYHDFRVIQRKSNPLGRSLFSYIIEQHRQTLHWLNTLPYVDGERIAFYGLSYGGKTAVRVPTLLPHITIDKWGLRAPGYCLSICSADFNEWIRKNASAEDRYSYVYTPEYEIFEWNMGHVANYAELSWLMAPRPFMVERGHDDGVAPDEWVGWEYAKVRRHYTKLGIADQTEIEWFDGPHTINGQRTFEFLHRHMSWPPPQQSPAANPQESSP